MLNAGDPINLSVVPAHGVALLALRPVLSDIQYLGSNLHISMGLELTQMEKASKGLELNFDLPRKANGDIFLKLIKSPEKVILNNAELPFEEVLNLVYKIPIAFEGHATLIIQ